MLSSPLDSNNDKLFIRVFHATFGQCSKPVKVSLLLYTHRGALCGIFQLIPIIEIYNSLKKRRVQKKCPVWQWNVALTITCCLSPKSCPLFYKRVRGLSNALWITDNISQDCDTFSSLCISLQSNKNFRNSSLF